MKPKINLEQHRTPENRKAKQFLENDVQKVSRLNFFVF